MSSTLSRTVTTAILDWRGILIRVTYERQRFADHLQIETLEPARAPLPITETGYRSHFVPKEAVERIGSPEAFVEAWLDETATGKQWLDQEATIRQYAMF